MNKKRTIVPLVETVKPALKKAYVYVADIECDDCFSLVQTLIQSIKGVQGVSLEKGHIYAARKNKQPDNVIVTYDSTIPLDVAQIEMMLNEWNFELVGITL